MFDHVEIKVVRFDSCQHFYATVLAPLLIELKWSDETAAGFGLMGRDHVQCCSLKRSRIAIYRKTGL